MDRTATRRAPSSAAAARSAARLARIALSEDRAGQDRTSRIVVPATARARGRIVAQATGVLAGVAPALATARRVGLRAVARRQDGDRVTRGMVVLELHGPARALLAAERTMLNFLMHLSGVATTTAAAVRAVAGARPPIAVRATRKTLPGLRDLEKAAVVAGGGEPHRRDLSAAVLLKDTHAPFARPAPAVRRLRERYGPTEPIQVEVRSLAQARSARAAGADRLLLDNRTPAAARAIVRGLVRSGLRGSVEVELSGGLTVGNLHRYRRVGADAVSLGELTHSARALPFHLVVSRSSRRDR